MIKDGLIIALIGMTTVFGFLTLAIISMYVMSFLIQWLNKYFPEEVVEQKVAVAKDNLAEIAVAIAVAKSKS